MEYINFLISCISFLKLQLAFLVGSVCRACATCAVVAIVLEVVIMGLIPGLTPFAKLLSLFSSLLTCQTNVHRYFGCTSSGGNIFLSNF